MSPSPRALLATTGLALCLTACGSPEPPRHLVLDLAVALPGAEIRQEVATFDLGTPAAREHLVSGWSRNERTPDGTTFVWSLGEESVMTFFLTHPRALRLELRGAPFEGETTRTQSPRTPTRGHEEESGPRVALRVNGEPVAEISLSPGMETYRLDLPASLLQGGDNRLALRYSRVASGEGRERRRLGVAWDGLALRPLAPSSSEVRPTPDKGLLEVPWGSEVRYFLEAPEDGVLCLEGVRFADGGGPGSLIVLARPEAGEEEVLTEVGAESSRLRLPLPPSPGLIRLTLRAVGRGPTPAGSTAGGLRLLRPEIRSPAPPPTPEPASSGPPRLAGSRPPVIIYLVDTLRADRVGVYGGSRGLTPHLDAFARDALVFPEAVAPSSWTRPSVATLLTGLHPLSHGVTTLESRLPEEATTLGEIFQAVGYRTAAFSTNWHILPATGFAQGFDDFLFLGNDDPSSAALHARVVQWLDQRDSEDPFFLYIHALDPHAPYEPPTHLRHRFAPGVDRPGAGSTDDVKAIFGLEGEERATRLADLPPLYDAEVAANDESFGLLLDALSARGLLDESLVLFTSDHGEGFDEHGFLGHGNTLHRELLHIPLVLQLPLRPKAPGERLGREVPGIARLEDILPTLVTLLGLELPGPVSGRNLFAAPVSPASLGALSHLTYAGRDGASLTWGDWTYIEPWSRAFGDRPLLYHLGRDPGELSDLTEDNPVRAGFLASRLRLAAAAARLHQLTPESTEPDPEMVRGLKALGYL